jgi:hypothetical protein
VGRWSLYRFFVIKAGGKSAQPTLGLGRFVFPSAHNNARPMSDNAILAAMRRMGIGKE